MTSVVSRWTNRLGDRAPQFLRECRSRLTPRGVFAAVGLVLIAIGLLFLSAWTDVTSSPGKYCIEAVQSCNLRTVDWSKWWRGIFQTLTWAIPYLSIGLGTFKLVNDLQQEEQQGTLNFLRLSPRKSWEILLGKLFGVPILEYLAIALVLPIHWLSGLLGNLPVSFLLSYDLHLGIDLFSFYSVALLIGLLGARTNRQAAQGLASGSLALLVPLLSFSVVGIITQYRFRTIWESAGRTLYGDYRMPSEGIVSWFGMNLANPVVGTIVGLLQTGVFVAIVWWVLHRCYQTPQNPVFSKVQSYVLTAAVQLNLLGYLWSDSSNQVYFLFAVLLVAWILFAVTIGALTPQRQMLMDWVNTRQTPLLKDLVVGERSPIHLAIAINIGLLAIVPLLLTVFGLWRSNLQFATSLSFIQGTCLALALAFSLMMVYASLIQLLMSARHANRAGWTVGILSILIVVPLACSWFLTLADYRSVLGRILIMFTPFSTTALTRNYYFLEGTAIGWVVVLTELAMIGGLTYLFMQRLEKFKRSLPRDVS